MLHIPAYGLSGLLAGVFNVVIGIFVYLRSPNRKLGRIWILFTFVAAVYGFGTLWVCLIPERQDALLAWQILNAFGVMWISAFFYHIVCTFCEISRPRSILINYLVTLAFVLTVPSHYFLSGVRWVFDSFFYETAGPLFAIFLVWWIASVIYSHSVLIRCYNKVSFRKKHQIKYFFLAMIIGFAGGSLSFLPAFGLDLYPWGNFSIFLYPFIMSYAILKHNMLDITLIIRKTLIYSVVTSALTILYLNSAFLITLLARGWIGPNAAVSYGIAASIVAILFHPLRNKVQIFVDKRFFRETVNRERKILELSGDILIQKSPAQLAALFSNLLEEAFHPKQVILYLRSPVGKEFERITPDVVGYDKVMPEGNAWAHYFSSSTEPVFQADLISNGGNPHAKSEEAVSMELRQLRMAAVLPLMSQGGLLGYLFLGEKKSEEPYTQDEVWLLRNAVNQATLAYERHLLDNELREAPHALETMASSFVHEIKTPMSNIKLPADSLMMYLKTLESGRRSLEELLPLLIKNAQYIQEQAVAGAGKIEAIRQMSKNQKDNYVALDPAELIKNSLSPLDQLITQSKVKLDVSLSEPLRSIYGNPQQLGIVFMNLVKNGIEAMVNDSGSALPKVLSVEGHMEGDSIVITVKDAGPGIKPEHINRLFHAYFSTKGSSGTGMGLFLTQEVIKAHGGTVSVKSEFGQGTAFIVRLPIYKSEIRQAV